MASQIRMDGVTIGPADDVINQFTTLKHDRTPPRGGSSGVLGILDLRRSNRDSDNRSFSVRRTLLI